MSDAPTPQLWFHEQCPFAHRVRAMLHRLGVEVELKSTSLVHKEPEFLALSPTGRVPLLVDGEVVLYESAVIAAYLAETRGWDGALPGDAACRARQRLAMKRFDDLLSVIYYRPVQRYPLGWSTRAQRRRVHRELDVLAETVAEVPVDSLLGVHLGCFWARFVHMSSLLPVVGWVRDRPNLVAWLDRAAALDAVQQTAPDYEALERSYRAQRLASLVLVVGVPCLMAVSCAGGALVVSLLD